MCGGPLSLIEHAQQHAEQLWVLQVRGHYQACAFHNLRKPGQPQGACQRIPCINKPYICRLVLTSHSDDSDCKVEADGYLKIWMRPAPTWPRVDTAVKRLLPPALSWIASMMRGRTSPMWVRSPGPATLASSPVVASTLATTPLSPPPAM